MPSPIFLRWWSVQVFPSTLHQTICHLTCVARHLRWSLPLAHHMPKEHQISPYINNFFIHMHQASYLLDFLCFDMWWKCAHPGLASQALHPPPPQVVVISKTSTKYVISKSLLELVPPLQLSLMETPSFLPTENPKFCQSGNPKFPQTKLYCTQLRRICFLI
jgi:hypothetical protein